MYSLVGLLSLAACASFALAFVRGRRGHVVLLGVWLVLLLYTHTWGLFLAGGMAIAWLVLWRRGRVEARDGAWLAAAVALAYAPWVPTLVYQALNTAAPWAERPSPLLLLAIPGGLFGYVAAPVLAVTVIAALRRRGAPDEAVRVLATIAAAAAGLAWLCSQAQPAWSNRYLAVLLGPLLLALAAVLARGPRWTAAVLAGVAAVWLLSGPPHSKSNVRTVAFRAAPEIRAGDLVVSTQPEQVPVLYRYLPAGAVYLTPLGRVEDPRQTDWRDGVARLRTGQAERRLAPLVARLPRGRRILLVTPVALRSQSPWARAVRVRTREWRAALRGDPRLRSIGAPMRSTLPRPRNTVRGELFEVR